MIKKVKKPIRKPRAMKGTTYPYLRIKDGKIEIQFKYGSKWFKVSAVKVKKMASWLRRASLYLRKT